MSAWNFQSNSQHSYSNVVLALLPLLYLTLKDVLVGLMSISLPLLGRPTKCVSNHWNRIWNGTVEWKMEWNSGCTQLQRTHITGTAQSRLN